MNPEVEKPGLLRPRPLIGASPEGGGDPGPRGSEARRPADVYIPRLGINGPTALDFAVTSGLRTSMIARSTADPSAAVNAYAETKRAFLNTAQQCLDAGITFIPMTVDGAGGGWGDDAERVWASIAHATAATTGAEVSSVTAELYQGLSLILHREGARAVLRRLPGAVAPLSSALASAHASLVSAPGDAIFGTAADGVDPAADAAAG